MKSLYRLREVLSPYRLQVSLLLLVVLGATLANLAIPAILQRIIDVGLAQDRMLYLGLSALVILLVGSARSLHVRANYALAISLPTVSAPVLTRLDINSIQMTSF